MNYTKMMSSVAGASVVGLSLSFTAPAYAGGVLKSAVADWTGGAVMCEIIHQIVESELDYKVKRITMPSGPGLREAIRSGDIDYACESWPSYDSVKEKYVKEYGGDGSVQKIADAGVVGISSYYVPRYMVEGDGATAPDLKSWEDMNKYAALFKTLETGEKGRLIGCPAASWECKDQERMDALGLNYTSVELGSEAAHWAEMQAAYKRKEPFIAYAWEPHWIHAALDLVRVELPEHSDEKWPATGWAKDITYNYGNPDFIKDNPKVAKLIENFRLTNDMQAPLILAIDVDGKDMKDVVAQWLQDNESTWKGWLSSGS